jgi:ribosomal protein S18 acetylase RimI-like enzyme
MAGVIIRALTTANRETFLGFMAGPAFADNAAWSGCFCWFPHSDRAPGKWDVTAGDQNRASASAGIESGHMRGYLAFVDDEAAGWCSANVRSNYTIFDADERDGSRIGMLACFVVAERFRHRGIARALLDAACEGFLSEGVLTVESYPRRDGDATDSNNHYGPLSMYRGAGFSEIREEGGFVLVRKQLA